MSTFVAGKVARSVGFDSFVGITGAEVISFDGGITFDGELTAQQVSDVWWFMTSTDDVDQARRMTLAALRDAVVAAPTLENVAALAVAHANYRLGE